MNSRSAGSEDARAYAQLRQRERADLTLPRKEPPLIAFGARLEVIRRRYGRATNRPRLPMNEFAQQLGITAARYRRYERGEVPMPYPLLTEVRRLTGASLDWLIADMPPGDDVVAEPTANHSTVGQRLRWARETQCPDISKCASVMGIPLWEWIRYERDEATLPLEMARRFAHKYSVSLDYLYEGHLTGIAPVVEGLLVEKYPHLLSAHAQAATQMSRTHSDQGAGRSARRSKPRKANSG